MSMERPSQKNFRWDFACGLQVSRRHPSANGFLPLLVQPKQTNTLLRQIHISVSTALPLGMFMQLATAPQSRIMSPTISSHSSAISPGKRAKIQKQYTSHSPSGETSLIVFVSDFLKLQTT